MTGRLQPDAGQVVKAKASMKIAHLTQEFDVVPSRTVRCSLSQPGMQEVTYTI